MEFVEYLKQGFEIFKLNEREIDNAAKDSGALTWGMAFIVIGSLAGTVGLAFSLGFSAVRLILGLVTSLVGFFLVGGLVHLTATRLFNGKGDYMSLLRPTSLQGFTQWPAVIPFVGSLISMLLGLWALVVMVVTIRNVYRLDTFKAAASLVIPLVVIVILHLLLAAAVISALGLGAFLTGSMMSRY